MTRMAKSYSEWPRVADPLRAKHESFPEETRVSLHNANNRYMSKGNFKEKGVAGARLFNGRELK